MKTCLFFTCILLSFLSFCWQPDRDFAETAFIYKGFGSGGTTAALRFYSKTVDTLQKVTKIQLNSAELDTLNFIIRQVKPQRHFQRKIGPSFYGIVVKNGAQRRIALVPDWAILDLASSRQYVFKGTPYAEMYRRFMDRNYR